MSERIDYESERGLIGALLNDPLQVVELHRISAEDFADPRCRYVFEVVAGLVAEAQRLNRPVELPAIQGRVVSDGKAEWFENGLLLINWFQQAFPGSIGYYVEKVLEASALRKFSVLGQRLQQAADTAMDLDAARDVAAQVMTELYVAADDALVTEDAPVPGLSTWEEFIDAPGRTDYDWVIPELLERHDRVIVIAGEGVGKSVLGRQVALMTSAGRHVFFPDLTIPPMRSLVVDLENPPSLVARQGGQVLARCRELGIWTDGIAHVWRSPDGIDIRKAADARLLERVIRETRPDLLVAGPLYKLASTGRRGETYEAVAEDIRTELDRLRSKYGFALWLEHHMPKSQPGRERDLDPLGSGVWMRWPEFGITLKREWAKVGNHQEPTGRVFVSRFRPDRAEGRAWPGRLMRGAHWPWRAEWSDQELADLGRFIG